MKKTRLKKKGKSELSKLQAQLWVLCKKIIRKKYENECYTCGKKGLAGYDWQTGHMLPKASVGAFLKYDIRILRPQCSVCNLWRNGEGAEFLRRMIIREGQEYVDQIFRDKALTVKAIDHYRMLIEKYKIMEGEL